MPSGRRHSPVTVEVHHMWRLFGAHGLPSHSFLASQAKFTGSVNDQHAIVSRNNRLNRIRTPHFP